jgi:DNA replication protein DnaC
MELVQETRESIQLDAAKGSTQTSFRLGQKNECPICRGTGWEVVQVPNGEAVKFCECQKLRIAEDRIRVVLQNWPEYKNARLEDFKPRSVGQQNALTSIRENPRGNYLLTGLFSRGKTHLMVAQYRHLALAGEKCILRSARDLMEELRKAEAPPDPHSNVFESQVLQMVNLAPSGHLFIDDIDKAPARSQFRTEMLFDIFDTIKRRQQGLTITTNLPMMKKEKDKKDLRDVLGDEVVSRLYRLCREIEL